MDKASITVERVNAEDVVFRIEAFDRSITEHETTFKLMRRVMVHDSRPVNDTQILFEQPIRWQSGRAEVPVSLSRIQAYSYSGTKIDVRVEATLHVNDALIFDTKITREYDLPLASRPRVSENAAQIIEPTDLYSFFDNFSAIPGHSQAKLVALMMVVGIAGVVVLGMALSAGNLVLAIVAVAGVAIVSFMLYRSVFKIFLRGYLEIDGDTFREPVIPGEAVRMDLLLGAKATVPVDELTVRVVAANMECGQYRRGHGTDVRTVSFREPVRGLVLYQRTIRGIAQGDSISDHLRGDLVFFDEMFEVLYPPNFISSRHGLDMVWEVQLLHHNFVDHEIHGVNEIFDYRHFLMDDLDEAPPEDDAVW